MRLLIGTADPATADDPTVPAVGAVLDTSVLFPAPLRDTLLRAAAEGFYLPVWSDTILDELRRNLITDLRLPPTRVARLVEEMRAHFPDAEVTGYETRIDEMTNHDKDRHVLAAAVVADARLIVTLDSRHFPEPALAPHGIVALHPDPFLLDLFARHPEDMGRLVEAQASDLRRNPLRVEQILERIARHAPSFAAAISRQRHREAGTGQ